MKFEEDFRGVLLADGPLFALVADRISWGELPQARPRPLIALWNVTRDSPRTMDGNAGIEAAYVQCDCWADDAETAHRVADALKAACDALKFTDHGTTTFQGAFQQGRSDGNEPTLGAPAARYARVRLDVTVQFSA